MQTATWNPPTATALADDPGRRAHRNDDQDLPPALRNGGRVLAAITGLCAAAAMLVIGGLYAVFSSCADGQAQVCGALGGLVGPLEFIAVLGGTAAAFVGGVGTAVTSRARWIGAGLAIAFVLALLLGVLVTIQEPVELS